VRQQSYQTGSNTNLSHTKRSLLPPSNAIDSFTSRMEALSNSKKTADDGTRLPRPPQPLQINDHTMSEPTEKPVDKGIRHTPPGLRALYGLPPLWPLSNTEERPVDSGVRRTPPGLVGVTMYQPSRPFISPKSRDIAEELAVTSTMDICSTCGVQGHTKDTHRHRSSAAQGLAIRLKPTSDSRMSL
jgi:hypothetical protein